MVCYEILFVRLAVEEILRMYDLRVVLIYKNEILGLFCFYNCVFEVASSAHFSKAPLHVSSTKERSSNLARRFL